MIIIIVSFNSYCIPMNQGDYKSPRWISGQVRNLISKILVTEPSKRYTLSDIKRHVWYGAVDKSDIPQDISTGAKLAEMPIITFTCTHDAVLLLSYA